MNKVVINVSYGGFGFSEEAAEWMKKNASKYNLNESQMASLDKSNPNYSYFDDDSIFKRHCKIFVDCVEALGEEANGKYSDLKVVEIKGDRYKIEEYDGFEHLVTPEDDDWIIVE